MSTRSAFLISMQYNLYYRTKRLTISNQIKSDFCSNLCMIVAISARVILPFGAKKDWLRPCTRPDFTLSAALLWAQEDTVVSSWNIWSVASKDSVQIRFGFIKIVTRPQRLYEILQ